MCFVDDQQFEVIADPVHVTIGALERGHGDRLEVAFPIAETSDVPLVAFLNDANPLFEKSAGRNHT